MSEEKSKLVIGENISDELKNMPVWELLGFYSVDEYRQYREFQRSFDPERDNAAYEDISEWNLDTGDF